MKKKLILLVFSVILFGILANVWARDKKHGYTNPHPVKSNKSAFAKVYFSNEIPVLGIAKEGKEFDIDPSIGSFLYLVVDNYPDNFNYNQVKIKAYKTVNGVNQFHDEKTYDINGNLYYTYIKYSFYSDGYYIFDVYNKNGTLIGSTTVNIFYKGAAGANQTGTTTTTSSSYDHYAKSRVYFSTETPYYGIAKDVKSFNINKKGGYVYVIVDNYPTNFNVNSFKLYVYKKKRGKYEVHDEATYDMDGNKYFTYFKYTFYDEGDYKFIIYDGLNRYVNTGYVTIK